MSRPFISLSRCLVPVVRAQATFVLHESFTNPRRDVEFPPYELTETGWGEFDIVVTVTFKAS